MNDKITGFKKAIAGFWTEKTGAKRSKKKAEKSLVTPFEKDLVIINNQNHTSRDENAKRTAKIKINFPQTEPTGQIVILDPLPEGTPSGKEILDQWCKAGWSSSAGDKMYYQPLAVLKSRDGMVLERLSYQGAKMCLEGDIDIHGQKVPVIFLPMLSRKDSIRQESLLQKPEFKDFEIGVKDNIARGRTTVPKDREKAVEKRSIHSMRQLQDFYLKEQQKKY